MFSSGSQPAAKEETFDGFRSNTADRNTAGLATPEAAITF
jgi:hypothetical protein